MAIRSTNKQFLVFIFVFLFYISGRKTLSRLLLLIDRGIDLLVDFCNRFVLSFCYYGISFGVSALSGNLYLNISLMVLVEIPANFVCVYFADRWVTGT